MGGEVRDRLPGEIEMAKPKLMMSMKKIGAREKAWIVVWITVVLWLGYVRLMHQPRAAEWREVTGQLNSAERQKISLLAKQPDVEKKKQELETLKQEISSGYAALAAAEENLLDDQDVDRLLDSLVKDRRKFELILNSIRPVQQKEPSTVEPSRGGTPMADPYRRLLVQLDLFGTFQGLVSYVDFLEQMRPYQEVQSIKVRVEGKEVSRPHAILQVAVLMGQTQKEKEESRKEIFALVGDIADREKKDPFLTGDKPKEVVQAVGLELSGILSEGGRPVAAMINNEIYSVGQVIQGKRITAIEANRVILEQGNRRFILVSGQSKEATQ